jgi:pyrimidine-nucleoside phosphorylase
MRAIDIIQRKRDGHTLTREAIDALVQGVTDGTWPDYQVTAFLMAVFIKGMTLAEATDLTQAMVDSGARLDYSDLVGPGHGVTTVDKHSTGGVGDKASLILAPLAAACGALVPMMSGRGLGHTGGTLDKLAAIPGFRTDLSVPEMRAALVSTGCVLIRQTADVAPADRRMYALRDATGTVESLPLIASSILSKKITEGIGALVLDVKVGSGGFMADLAHARELASWLVGIAERSGLRTEALLTRMETPLGRRVGNASEVLESIQTLRGEGPSDLEDLSVILAARMLVLAGVAPEAEAEGRVRDALVSGRGLEKFGQIIAAQGGDPRVIDNPALLPLADREFIVRADRSGVITTIDAGCVGRAAVVLGAGRDHVDAVVDPGVGIDLVAVEGTAVREGDPILRVYYRETARLDGAQALLRDAVTIGDVAQVPQPLVLERIDRHAAGTLRTP